MCVCVCVCVFDFLLIERHILPLIIVNISILAGCCLTKILLIYDSRINKLSQAFSMCNLDLHAMVFTGI